MSDETRQTTDRHYDFSLLRQEAEKLQKPVTTEEVQDMPLHEVRQLIQELQIHQVELEMQNHQLQLATQELEEERAKYHNLYQHSPFGYVTLDEHGVIEEANAKGVQLLASSKDHLVARRFSQFVHQYSRDAYYGFFRKVLFSEKAQTVELEVVSNQGTVFYALLEGILLRRENDTDQCRIAFIDVTERKTAHLELSNKEALLSAVFNSSLNGIQVFKAVRDSAGTLLDFEWMMLNRTAELFLDHSLEQLRRSRLTDIMRLNGELDASSCLDVDKHLEAALDKSIEHLWIDCEELKYISSAGLGVLISHLGTFHKRNIQLVLYGMSEHVRNVFVLLGLHKIMTIVPSRKDAEMQEL